jgi:hypothetical protein
VNQVLLLILLALLALVFLGVGIFVVKWLLIIAAIIAVIWLISAFAGAAGGRTRGAWW